MLATLMPRANPKEQVGFGAVLRRYRVAAGLTQEALAERAGLSPRGISDLERGARTRPYLATVRRLAEALGLSDADRRVLQTAAHARCAIDRRSADHPGDLPVSLTSFVGREHELAELRQLITAHRLVTLLGPGGIGKTRLAVEIATGLVDAFAEGVVFVPLASVRDPNLVVGAMAQALGIQEMGSRGLSDRLHIRLRDADVLLLLDNFEHVLPAADGLASLLANCPKLRFLVTSRAPLRISGERELAVSPLALPSARTRLSGEQLRTYESVRLFLDRGASVGAQLVLTDDQTRVVAEICSRLDGLPLAIELAAARLRVLTADDLLERLEARLPLLVGGPRDAPARQQTLTATISWSYDLLDESEKELFRHLSVFVGGFTLEAAESVCVAQASSIAVLDGLESLLAQNLIQIQRDEEARTAPRFRMLETVREYALERAHSAAELAELRRRHAAYFTALAELAQAKLTSIDAPEWLQRLEAEHNNLRAALHWAVDEHDADTALRLSSAIWQFWYAAGYLTEGSRWLDEALRLADGVASNQPDGARGSIHVTARARALTGAGVLAHYQGHYARAATLCGQSLALSRQVGDQLGTADALHGLALVARSGGDFAMARTMYEEARRIRESMGDRWGLSYSLRYLAVVLWMETEYAAARRESEAAVALANEIGDRQGCATALTVRSYVARSLGNNDAAEAAAREALSLHESYGDRRGAAQALWALGMATAGQGHYGEAGAHYKRAVAVFSDVGDRFWCCICLTGLAEVALALGHPRDAVCLLAATSAIMAAIGGAVWPSIEPHIQRTLKRARVRLGGPEFKLTWARGESLSVEQAVALAMSVPESQTLIEREAMESRPNSQLTARELDVASRVARGLTNKQIAAELVIAEGTADRHVSNILGKLGFNSRAQVAAWAVKHPAEMGAGA
jgi:predicted ATPase/DNA-binding CsgD family transcriptional regulator/DNA-binding XRE family transcriptional regulator